MYSPEVQRIIDVCCNDCLVPKGNASIAKGLAGTELADEFIELAKDCDGMQELNRRDILATKYCPALRAIALAEYLLSDNSEQ